MEHVDVHVAYKPSQPTKAWGRRESFYGLIITLSQAYAARGRALYVVRAFVLALNCLLPVLRVVKRARLAVQDQPSPSKPVIPRTVFKVLNTMNSIAEVKTAVY